MAVASIDQHIESTPGVCGGRPRIAGRRIRVQDIAVWHVQHGLTAESIAQDYKLPLAEIHAALAYYFDHRAEIDEALERDRVFEEEMKKKHPSMITPEAREAYYKKLGEQSQGE